MKNTILKQFAITFLTICAIVFGLTAIASAAVKPDLISKAVNGDSGNGTSQNTSVSADGRYIVFDSFATNLVSGITDTNNAQDIFLRDTQTGTIRCLSCTPAANSTSTANGGSAIPIITPDGRYVVFVSAATNLVSGVDSNNTNDVFRFDTQTNERVLVSSAYQTPSVTGNDVSGSNGSGRGYDMSDDGRYIAFSSQASNLTGISDTNNKIDVFVRDMQDGATYFVSRNLNGNAATGDSFDPSISANGQSISFTSTAEDLVNNDRNSNNDVFYYNFQTGTTKLVSRSPTTGMSPTGASFASVISKNGNRIAYFTGAYDITNVPIPQFNPYKNIVAYDVDFDANSLVTVNVSGNGGGSNETGNSNTIFNLNLSISADGRYVTFESRAGNLTNPQTTNVTFNVYRRDLRLRQTELVSITTAGNRASVGSALVGVRANAMSSDGRFIVFKNIGDTFADFPGNTAEQVYVRDMLNGVTTALTLNNTGTALGNSTSDGPAISANGKSVVFISNATDLTPTPTMSNVPNVFKAKVPTPQKAVSDFDGDGKTDFAVWRPSTGAWFVLPSVGNYIASTIVLGTSGDLLAPADYSGDGRTDYAVFRPSNGTWYIINSSTFAAQTIQFGQNGDLPVPADYDGDGKADIAVYRPSTGVWYRLNSSDGAFVANSWGTAGDKPAVGDFDGDGKADLAVYRPSNGVWYIVNSSSNQYKIVGFGAAEDLAVPADYDGDGKTDIAVFRPSTSTWYRLNSLDGAFSATSWGAAGDKPVPADYDGDGKADVAVYRSGVWYVIQSTNGQIGYGNFGDSTVVPLPNAYVR